MNMKKFIFILGLIAICFSSCSRKMLPRATNSINTASLDVLNLERKDYEILNTITAEASVIYHLSSNSFEIRIPDDDFSCEGNFFKGTTPIIKSFTGTFKSGNLSGTAYPSATMITPEITSKELALYRIINIAKQEGADAVIAPTISMNIEQVSKRETIYKTIVTAKLVKFKTNN
ncbi:MAG: hypothetical protein K2I90_11290 [Odoribacter sp.]|nr:hypothetical protein [Odoribacter sp.]